MENSPPHNDRFRLNLADLIFYREKIHRRLLGLSYLEDVFDCADETHVVFDHLRELVEVCRRLQLGMMQFIVFMLDL